MRPWKAYWRIRTDSINYVNRFSTHCVENVTFISIISIKYGYASHRTHVKLSYTLVYECKRIIGFVTEVIKRKKTISPPNPLRTGGLILLSKTLRKSIPTPWMLSSDYQIVKLYYLVIVVPVGCSSIWLNKWLSEPPVSFKESQPS